MGETCLCCGDPIDRFCQNSNCQIGLLSPKKMKVRGLELGDDDPDALVRKIVVAGGVVDRGVGNYALGTLDPNVQRNQMLDGWANMYASTAMSAGSRDTDLGTDAYAFALGMQRARDRALAPIADAKK